jgi:hypothetical protein
MEPRYYQVLFSKDNAGHRERFKVYIKLSFEDKTILTLGGSVELRTRGDCETCRNPVPFAQWDRYDWPPSGKELGSRHQSFMGKKGIVSTIVAVRNVWVVNGG